MRYAILAALLPPLIGCASGGPVTDCSWAEPILIDRHADMLTEETARQIKAHNETGAALGCW